MKKAATRTMMFMVTILMVLAISAMQVAPVLADDAAPPPPEPTEVAPPEEESGPEAPPVEPAEAPVTDVEEVPPTAEPVVPEEQVVAMVEPQADPSGTQPETPAEVLAQVPEGTELIVLDESGEALSLASEEAVEAFYTGNPIWCPVGVIPSPTAASCSGSFSTFNDPDGGGPEIGLIQWLIAHPKSVAGVIWISGDYSGTVLLEGGAIEFDGASFDNPLAPTINDFALTIKGGWTGTGTGVNVLNWSEFNVPFRVVNWNGSITLSDIVITNTTGGDALTVTTTKDITLTRVKSNNNTGGEGAHLDNSGGTGKVTINSSEFKQNSGIYGLYVLSHGAITLTNVTASQNNSTHGARLDNCVDLGAGCTTTAASGVILNGSTFSDNSYAGLVVISRGLISANDLTANGNGIVATNGGGVILDNAQTGATAGVTLTGTNIFTDNYSTGLIVYSKGAIKLNNLIANGNDSLGYGANLDNSGSPTAQPITLTGTNQFKYNRNAGLKIASKGLITLNNVNASGSLAGYGVQIDQCVWGGSACAGSALGGVKLTGTNLMNDNYQTGLDINSVGTITLNNVTASGNGLAGAGISNYGAYITNLLAVTPKAVTLTGTNTFTGNYSTGLYIESKGNIAISNLTASDTVHGQGAQLSNTAGTGGITLSGTNRFDGNYSTGLEADSVGAITLAAVTATGNGTGPSGNGVSLDNYGGSSKPVTLTGINVFSGNHDIGLDVNSTGPIKLNAVTASDNTSSFGALVQTTYNNASIAAVTLSGINTFNNNGNVGLYMDVYGIVILSNLHAASNSGIGVYISNLGIDPLAPRNVLLTGSSTFDNNTSTGLWIGSYGTITLSNISATGNGVAGLGGSGVVLHNSSGSLPRGVTLSGTNTFNSNIGTGLEIVSLGAITVSGLTANDNGDYGANLANQSASTPQAVKLPGTNVLNGNYSGGLSVNSRGAITINNLTASNNTHGSGASLNNDGLNAVGAVILTGTNTFNNNYSTGLNVGSRGTITINNLTANANGSTVAGFGAWITNSAGTPQFVKLTGTNTFNGNYSGGLYVYSLGAVTINNLTASHTAIGSGTLINNAAPGAGGVTLTGFTNASENSAQGIDITSLGNVSLTKITADGNSTDGLYVNTTGNVTLTCGSFTSNGQDGVELLTPLATLKGVFASGNGALNYNIPVGSVIVRSCPLP